MKIPPNNAIYFSTNSNSEVGLWDAKFHFKLTNKTNSVPAKALPDEDKFQYTGNDWALILLGQLDDQ